MFTSEEPTRFGFGCLGSRAMAQTANIFGTLQSAVDAGNVSFVEAARRAGYTKAEHNIESCGLKTGDYASFVELHIEQGPILEKEGVDIHHLISRMLMYM